MTGRPGLAWMRDAACADAPELPWIGARPGHVIPGPLLLRMADLCDACPVQTACADYANHRDNEIIAGFWSGAWRHDNTTTKSAAAADGGQAA